MNAAAHRDRIPCVFGEAARLLAAMPASAIPAGFAGPWGVLRYQHRAWTRDQHGYRVAPGTYTALQRRQADGKLTSVMSDDLPELCRHLEFLLIAEGRVLLTGLGLGCALRGVLARPQVTAVDVVEIDAHVLELVQPHLPADPRLRVHHAEARAWIAAHPERTWDCAWHDLWTDRSAGEPQLNLVHLELLSALRRRITRWQGAWACPRFLRRAVRQMFPSTRAWQRPRRRDRGQAAEADAAPAVGAAARGAAGVRA